MPLTVESASDAHAGEWNRFVEEHDKGTFFHRSEWRGVLESSFGHRSHYCLAREDGRIVGVLPLSEIRSLLFGHHLVSTPFCVYGGILASNERAHAALTEHACRLAEQLQVEDLELRNLAASRSGWPTKDLYVTFRKSIAGNTEENLKAIPRKQRAMVRKGIDAGLQGSVTDEPDRVYRIYAESVRNLGTPVFGKHYFRALAESFGSACEISVIRHGDRDIAGVMSFYFKDQVLPYYGGSLPVARALKGNDFMYWDLMCRATERGARLFDFGRSKVGTGPYSFKKNWGFHPEPLNYEYYLVKARDVPRLDPANPKYERLVNLWRQLPLPIANLLGPMLARDLG